MKVKEIWIRVKESSQVEEAKSVILELIQEDETLAGEISVVVYAMKERAIGRLSHIYDLSECAVNVLKERFGDDNVKITELCEPAPIDRIADAHDRNHAKGHLHNSMRTGERTSYE